MYILSRMQSHRAQRRGRNKSAFHGNNGTYPFAIEPRYCNFLLGSSTKASATRSTVQRFSRKETRTRIKITS